MIWRNRTFLVIIDFISLYLALVAAIIIRGAIHTKAIQTEDVWISAHLYIFLPSLLFSILAFYISGLYDWKVLYDRSKVFALLIYSQISTALFSVIFFYFAKTDLTPRLTLFLYIVSSIAFLSVSRLVYLGLVYKLDKIKAIFISSENNLINNLNPEHAPYVVINKSWSEFEKIFKDNTSADKKDKISSIIFNERELDVERVLLVENLKNSKYQVYTYNQYYELIYKKVDLENFDWDEFIKKIGNIKETTAHYIFRRFIDIFCGILVFIPFVISLPFVCFINIFFSKGNLFSVQDRVGFLGARVWLYKLRTMTGTDSGGLVSEGSDKNSKSVTGLKVTKFGAILRKTRLDELPQCLNLFKNEVSMIGPRADIIGVHNDMSQKINNFKLKLLVPQGLTGWAQVHMSFPPRTLEEHVERFAFELYYIKNRSILLDVSVILKTIKTLISRTGA